MHAVAGEAIVDLSVFSAFSNAIIYGVWQIGTCQHGTVVGNVFNKEKDLDVILDEGASSSINTRPEGLRSDLLVYVKPSQLPTLRTNKLVSSYMLYDSANDDYYQIIDAGVGKNQHTGEIEHVELQVVQTEVADANYC